MPKKVDVMTPPTTPVPTAFWLPEPAPVAMGPELAGAVVAVAAAGAAVGAAVGDVPPVPLEPEGAGGAATTGSVAMVPVYVTTPE